MIVAIEIRSAARAGRFDRNSMDLSSGTSVDWRNLS